MVVQYPYKLFVQRLSEGSINEQGNPVKPVEEWVEWCSCRDEHNGRAAVIQKPNGDRYVYLCVIYFDKSAQPISINTKIEVREKDYVRQAGPVMGYRKGQLNARVWL
jgi:hypothetical protein